MDKSIDLLNQHLNNIDWGRFQYYLFGVCGSAWLGDMLWVTGIGLVLDNASNYWQITNREKGFMASTFLFGALVGCYTWGYLGEKYGRMFSFKKTPFIIAVFSFLLALSYDPGFFLFYSMVIGFGIGGELALGGTVFAEFCPPKRLWTLTLLAIFWSLGGTIAGIIAMFVNFSGLEPQWRWQAAIIGSIIFSFGILRLWMPESPRYLLFARHVHEAEECLRKIITWNGEISPVILEERNAKTKDEEPLVAHEKENLMTQLFSKKYAKVTTLMSFIYFFGIGCFIALIEFMPTLLKDENIVSDYYKYEVITIQQLAGIPSVLVAALLVESCLGRKLTTAIPFFISGVFSYLFLYASSYKTVVLFSSLNTLFSIMGFSALYTITPESYDTDLRNLGVGYANALGKLGAILGPSILGLLLEVQDGEAYGLIGISVLFITVGFLSLLLSETRGKEIS